VPVSSKPQEEAEVFRRTIYKVVRLLRRLCSEPQQLRCRQHHPTTLAVWRLDERQGLPCKTTLRCSSLGNFCGENRPPLRSSNKCHRQRRRCGISHTNLGMIFNGSWALAILRETSKETSY